jgi:MATE family multidrug resistance protein
MNREILRIALPAIIANITIPLLGLIDTGIAGHLGSTVFIGAMAVGSMMFSLVYWNFSFLRMGTSGITAQAYGAGNKEAAFHTLYRVSALALMIAIALIALQYPIQWIALKIIGPSEEVASFARSYFYIVVWGAPAMLIMMGIKGWFLGMQDSTRPMMISIMVNVLDILICLFAVFVLHKGFIGIAIGTLAAEYLGLVFSIILLKFRYGKELKKTALRGIINFADIKRLFRVNSDIFFRSVMMLAVTLTFMAIGARSGDLVLAVNSLIMQLFLLYSYFMDGFGFAGEALTGRFTGAEDNQRLTKSIKYLFGWGAAVMVLFAGLYLCASRQIFTLLTNEMPVITLAMDYRFWTAAIPIAGMAAFIWDGIYIGLTATRGMLLASLMGCSTFFAIYFIPIGTTSNSRLWAAFIAYLLVRGAVQTVIYLLRREKLIRHSKERA